MLKSHTPREAGSPEDAALLFEQHEQHEQHEQPTGSSGASRRSERVRRPSERVRSSAADAMDVDDAEVDVAPASRAAAPVRTYANALLDHEAFERTGGKTANAAEHHSQCRVPLIRMEFVHRVVPPVLHIKLGLVLMLEEEAEETCRELDVHARARRAFHSAMPPSHPLRVLYAAERKAADELNAIAVEVFNAREQATALDAEAEAIERATYPSLNASGMRLRSATAGLLDASQRAEAVRQQAAATRATEAQATARWEPAEQRCTAATADIMSPSCKAEGPFAFALRETLRTLGIRKQVQMRVTTRAVADQMSGCSRIMAADSLATTATGCWSTPSVCATRSAARSSAPPTASRCASGTTMLRASCVSPSTSSPHATS